jgi:hypothetical protein
MYTIVSVLPFAAKLFGCDDVVDFNKINLGTPCWPQKGYKPAIAVILCCYDLREAISMEKRHSRINPNPS